MNWIIASLLSMVGFGFLSIVYKVLTQQRLKPELISFSYFIFASIMLGIFLKSMGVKLSVIKNHIPLIILAALFGTIANVSMAYAIKNSPNPGYVLTIINANALLTIIISVILLKSQIDIIKLLGSIIVLIGLSLMLI